MRLSGQSTSDNTNKIAQIVETEIKDRVFAKVYPDKLEDIELRDKFHNGTVLLVGDSPVGRVTCVANLAAEFRKDHSAINRAVISSVREMKEEQLAAAEDELQRVFRLLEDLERF